MAYAALVSVAQILDELLNTDRYGVGYPKPEIESLYNKVCFLQSSLDKLSLLPKSKRSRVKEWESRIRDVVYRAQDTIELFISRHVCSSSSEEIIQSIQLEEIAAELDLIIKVADLEIGEFDSITNVAEEIGENIIYENSSDFWDSSSSSVRMSTSMVGSDEDIDKLLDVLTNRDLQFRVIQITGSAGTGKTTLARTCYEHPLIAKSFDFRCWVTVSDDYNVRDILSILLSSTTSISSHDMSSEYDLSLSLYKWLLGRSYLIVMDDIWGPDIFYRVTKCIPNHENGSRIIFTSRNENVAANVSVGYHHIMHPLDEEKSWELLCEKTFGGGIGSCPRHLENIGRNIAEKCGGIPLSIVVVGGLLSQGPMTEAYWKTIEADVHGAAAADTKDSSYLDILYLSYNNLPIRLRACFLYMAAFQEDTEIHVTKLINLWVAEGFLTPPSPPQTLEEVAEDHLKDLIARNLITIRRMSSDGQPKTLSLQGNLRQVAKQECHKEKFFHAINRYDQQLLEGVENQRRISVHNNILLCSEDVVYECVKSIEAARTLLYAGPDHHHSLPFCLTFELLRVLDALAVYFVELPDALFELIHLRYLALTYDEDLSPSISKLRNLLTLIVRQHPKIMFRRTSFLPAAIWNLPQIRHLLFTESFFPDPCDVQYCSVPFENLQSLSNVNVACCTKEILQNMPNLKKLGTWIEEPGVVKFDLDQLKHLESFKFSVLKPIPGQKIEFQPQLVFPNTLRKLSLSGCGLPWEDMKVIAELPHLQVLKLREFAFQGKEWCLDNYTKFEQLNFLLLESLDLETWKADKSHFPRLERLIIRHCYRLEYIYSEIGFIEGLELIELVDCSPSAEESVDIIREEREIYGYTDIQFRIYSSWK